jgi:hypothetical protein
MAIGPGKYDDVCTVARETANAEGCILVILDGSQGSGFSCQATIEITVKLPALLRKVADEIEASL